MFNGESGDNASPWVNAAEVCSSNEVSWKDGKNDFVVNDFKRQMDKLKNKYAKGSFNKNQAVTVRKKNKATFQTPKNHG